jgi:F0F1-type ATP synthase gamma subunit
MQLVSAIKMKKAQQKAFEGKPYRELLSFIIQKVAASYRKKLFSPFIKNQSFGPKRFGNFNYFQ